MGHYELTILLHPYKLVKIEELIAPYLELINRSGSLLGIENWGKRNLAYSIDKLLKANYIYLKFQTSKVEIIEELNKDLRFDPIVIRKLLIKVTDTEYKASELMDDDLTSSLKKSLNLKEDEEKDVKGLQDD